MEAPTRPTVACRLAGESGGPDHEEDSCNLCRGFGIHHLHGGLDGRCRHRLIRRWARKTPFGPSTQEPVARRLAQRGLTMNTERIERNREARHALALSIAGVMAVMVFWNLTTLVF
jgi:hypothetical protein